MNAMIDLDSELIVDRSTIHNPYLRLLLAAIGEELLALRKFVGRRWAGEDVFEGGSDEGAVVRRLVAG